jgi:hypothetical protein
VVSGLTIYYFYGNQIAGHWQEMDRLGLLQQLGGSRPKTGMSVLATQARLDRLRTAGMECCRDLSYLV